MGGDSGGGSRDSGGGSKGFGGGERDSDGGGRGSRGGLKGFTGGAEDLAGGDEDLVGGDEDLLRVLHEHEEHGGGRRDFHGGRRSPHGGSKDFTGGAKDVCGGAMELDGGDVSIAGGNPGGGATKVDGRASRALDRLDGSGRPSRSRSTKGRSKDKASKEMRVKPGTIDAITTAMEVEGQINDSGLESPAQEISQPKEALTTAPLPKQSKGKAKVHQDESCEGSCREGHCTQGVRENAFLCGGFNAGSTLGTRPSKDQQPTATTRYNTSTAWKKPEFTKLAKVDRDTVLSADGLAIQPDFSVVDDNEERLERALVGKLLGKRLPFYFLNNDLKRKWGQFGSFKLILVAADCFICIFDSIEARDAVLMQGPWFLAGNILGLDRWTPEFNPHSLHGFSAPVWVRFPDLPLSYWDTTNIGRFASFIGEPLWVDHQTKEWGQSRYARVCIKVDLAKKLPSGVWIDGRKGRFFQRVEYEGIPLLCFHCGMVGHRLEECPKAGARHGPSVVHSSSKLPNTSHARLSGSSPGIFSQATEDRSKETPLHKQPAPPAKKNDMTQEKGNAMPKKQGVEAHDKGATCQSNIGLAHSQVQDKGKTHMIEPAVKEKATGDESTNEEYGPWTLVTRRRGQSRRASGVATQGREQSLSRNTHNKPKPRVEDTREADPKTSKQYILPPNTKFIATSSSTGTDGTRSAKKNGKGKTKPILTNMDGGDQLFHKKRKKLSVAGEEGGDKSPSVANA